VFLPYGVRPSSAPIQNNRQDYSFVYFFSVARCICLCSTCNRQWQLPSGVASFWGK
jgi:hypothetical protein